jgi:Flp pilus assembly protein TadD
VIPGIHDSAFYLAISMRIPWRKIWLVGGTLAVGLAVAAMAWGRLRSGAADARAVAGDVEAGRFAEAKGPLGRWLKARPDSAEARYYQGRVALALGDVAGAVEALNRANALGLFQAERDLLGGLIASKLGRHAEAEPLLRRAFVVAKRPDPQLAEALAKTYLETFDLGRGAAVIERWVRESPDDPKPFLWRAEVHRRSSNIERDALLNDYGEALKRDPDLAGARLGLADELRKDHRNAEAVAEYDAYLALEPDSAAGHLGAGRNLMETGDVAAATRHLDRAAALDPKDPSVPKELAELSIRRGDFAAALAHLDRAVRLDPDDPITRDRRAVALMRLGRTDEARAEQAAAKRVRVDLAQVNDLREKLIKSPHDRSLQIEAARWMFGHGHDAEGVRWAEQVLREAPGNPEASRLLADYYRRQGNPGRANFYRLQGSADTSGGN